MKHTSRKKIFFIALGSGIAIVLVGWLLLRSKPAKFETISATTGDITQEVLVTGRVKPIDSVELAFERGGKVSRVFAPIGTKVVEGQPLVSIDTADLSTQLLQAQAAAQSQSARLDGLRRGTRPEELSVKEAALKKAQDDLGSYYQNVPSVLRDAYAKADDAVRAKTDALFSNDDTSPQLTFNVTDSQAQFDVTSMRLSLAYELATWKSEIDAISATSSNLNFDTAISKSQGHARAVSDFLARALDAVNSASGISPTLVDTYKTNISVGRTNINTALTSINGEQQAILSQKNTVSGIDRELALARAGSTPDEIASQEALVKQAQAQVQSIEVQIAKSTLRSPIAGTVTRQDAKLGEIAPLNVTLVTVISERALEIEANVPEIDIGRVSLSNPVRVTLDAFPGETFSGKVSYIDPAETVLDGVVNFKVTVSFDVQDSRIKTGLTANLTIETLKKTGVIVIPQFAVIENDQGTFVKKVSLKGTTEEVPVTLGIRGQQGQVEVVSGVSVGDSLVNVGVKTSK